MVVARQAGLRVVVTLRAGRQVGLHGGSIGVAPRIEWSCTGDEMQLARPLHDDPSPRSDRTFLANFLTLLPSLPALRSNGTGRPPSLAHRAAATFVLGDQKVGRSSVGVGLRQLRSTWAAVCVSIDCRLCAEARAAWLCRATRGIGPSAPRSESSQS